LRSEDLNATRRLAGMTCKVIIPDTSDGQVEELEGEKEQSRADDGRGSKDNTAYQELWIEKGYRKNPPKVFRLGLVKLTRHRVCIYSEMYRLYRKENVTGSL